MLLRKPRHVLLCLGSHFTDGEVRIEGPNAVANLFHNAGFITVEFHLECDRSNIRFESPVTVEGGLGRIAQIVVASVGDNSVIGTSSVVTKDLPPNSVSAGRPARILRMRDEPETLRWR